MSITYSQTITANGGTAPYSFAVSSGNLPPGLSLSSGGVLAGIPTMNSGFSFIVNATDANGCTGSSNYSMNVAGPPPFTYVTNGNSITLTGYTGTNGVATIPATLNGWPLTGIGYQAFNGPGLTNVVIPNSVTNIATNAFYICTNLTNITVDAANPVYSSLNGVLFDKAQLSLIAFPSGRNGSYTVPNSVTNVCLLYTSPSPRDGLLSRMPSSA